MSIKKATPKAVKADKNTTSKVDHARELKRRRDAKYRARKRSEKKEAVKASATERSNIGVWRVDIECLGLDPDQQTIFGSEIKELIPYVALAIVRTMCKMHSLVKSRCGKCAGEAK